METKIHPYGVGWFSCSNCGGDFEHFNQVQDATGICEGCATLKALTRDDSHRTQEDK